MDIGWNTSTRHGLITGSALRKPRDPLSARITVIAAVDGPTPLLGPFPSEMTLMIEAEGAYISGDLSNRSYQVQIYWHAESACFQETEGSDQCQGNGSTCSGWSTSPAPTTLFRDDTDGMMLIELHQFACLLR